MGSQANEIPQSVKRTAEAFRPLKRALTSYIYGDPRLESLGYFQSSANADDHTLPYGRATAPVIDETSTPLAVDVDAARR